MEMAAVIGYLAAALTAFCNFPQLLRVLRRGETEDLSLRMYLMLATGLSLWVAYGLLNSDWPVVLANITSLMTVLPILFFILKKRF